MCWVWIILFDSIRAADAVVDKAIWLAQYAVHSSPFLNAGVGGQVEKLDPYYARISKMPAPSKFGMVWPAYQFPLGDNVGEVEREGPLLNVFRPQSAKVCP